MSSGSICTTQREKATGRAPMTALLDAARARADFQKDTGKYVPLVIDGGVSAAGDMIIALTVADVVMMGGYFNHFFEFFDNLTCKFIKRIRCVDYNHISPSIYTGFSSIFPSFVC